MEINTDLDSLHVLEALASDSRLKIINLLAHGDYNIQQIAKKMYMSSGIVTRHIQKLESAGLVYTKRIPGKTGSQKICSLAIDELYVRFPSKIFPHYQSHNFSIPVGHYTDFYAVPTCGLASSEYYIGKLDEPKFFMDSQRMDAELVWLSQGFLEYKLPNMLSLNQKPEMLEISLEISSEFPVSNNNWPSDISFYINDVDVGSWTVPGNFSDVRGKLTPKWWPTQNSQYGLLKTLRITPHETLMDGEAISTMSLSDIPFNGTLIKIRVAIEEDAKNLGGLTIFGQKFGNYPQNIECKLYYSEN